MPQGQQQKGSGSKPHATGTLDPNHVRWNKVKRLERQIKKAERKIKKLAARAEAGKPIGGKLEGRTKRLRGHIARCKQGIGELKKLGISERNGQKTRKHYGRSGS